MHILHFIASYGIFKFHSFFLLENDDMESSKGCVQFISLVFIVIIIFILSLVTFIANQHNYGHNKLPILDTFISVNYLHFLTSGCLHNRTSERLQLIHRKKGEFENKPNV